MTGLAFKHREVVLAGFDRGTVDRHDYIAGLKVEFVWRKRSPRKNFRNFQAVSLVCVVEECAEVGCRHPCSRCIIAAACMRCVKFSENFTKKSGKIIVVVDVRQERAVMLTVIIPVYTVEIGIIEFVFDLFPHVIEYIFTFFRRFAVIWSLKLYALGFSACEVDLFHAFAADDKQVLAFFVGHEAAADAFDKHFGIALSQVVDQKVAAAFGSCRRIVQFVAF